MKRYISILLIIVLLICCLINMPYGYYQLVRVIAFVGFGYLTYEEWSNTSNKIFFILFIVAALVFNPFLKLYLGKTLWQFTDVFYAIILIIYRIRLNKKEPDKYKS